LARITPISKQANNKTPGNTWNFYLKRFKEEKKQQRLAKTQQSYFSSNSRAEFNARNVMESGTTYQKKTNSCLALQLQMMHLKAQWSRLGLVSKGSSAM
jgi:hypothetical protein